MSLSANDVDKIRQLMQRVAKLETQAGNATRNIQRAPAHYLVVAPVGGIPAFEDPVPGQATCLMTRRFSDHPPAEKELAEMSTKQVVYNLGGKIAEGEIVMAHRDAFGDLFIPESNDPKIGKADSDITYGSYGTVSIWRNGADTTENIENVYLDWMHGDENVSAGKEVLIQYFADEDRWRIIGAECE